jgi:type VI secretion system protein ImpG
LKQLRFFLHGESQLTYALYELLLNDTSHVQLRPRKDSTELVQVDLSASAVRPVGFSADEGMLPYPPRSFLGYRLLQEYFAFAEKFLFFDVGELDRAAKAGFESGLEILIFLKRFPRLEQPINAGTFRLGCTPIINLFEQIAEPIRLNQVQTEYQVIPDIRRPQCLEVYSIDKVLSTSPQREEAIQFQPFYSLTHGSQQERQTAYWHSVRRPSVQKADPGTEVYLSLVGLDYQPTLPPVETLTIHTTCTNRDLPAKLPFGGDRGDFELEGAAPLSRIRCLTKPTEPIRPPQRHAAQWRLISSLSLNYLSIVEFSREALQELLRLYNFADSPVIRQQIAGITSVTSRRVTARSPHRVDFNEQGSDDNGRCLMPWNGFCRGIEVTIEFDETKYVGSGLFVFASVLERFLALYASLNSFTQMVARTQQREEALRQWPPRAGEQILL